MQWDIITELLPRLKNRLPEVSGNEQDGLLLELMQDAVDFILAYTCRDTLPAGCWGAVLRLAVIAYNRQGMEGESTHIEGGIHAGVEAVPEDVKAMLRPYRLGKVMG